MDLTTVIVVDVRRKMAQSVVWCVVGSVHRTATGGGGAEGGGRQMADGLSSLFFSQFIVVSLKDGMFNNANVLFKTKFVDGMSTVSRYTQHVPLGSRK